MSIKPTDVRLDEQVELLEKQVNRLLEVLASFAQENAELREREQRLMQDRTTLLDKNNKARVQVEAMLGRLKAMEHS